LGGVAKGGVQPPVLTGSLVLLSDPIRYMPGVDLAAVLTLAGTNALVSHGSVPILCPKCALDVRASLTNLNRETLFFEHHLMGHAHRK